jgi:hypothetical protein
VPSGPSVAEGNQKWSGSRRAADVADFAKFKPIVPNKTVYGSADIWIYYGRSGKISLIRIICNLTHIIYPYEIEEVAL